MPVSNWPGYEYFYLAEKLGLTKKQGLDLQTLEFPDPQAIVHAYLRGDLQIAQLTTVEAVDICARDRARCPVVVLVLDESRGADQLVARHEIPSIRHLRGRRVAVTPSTLGPYVLSRALERHGLRLAHVKVDSMTLDAMPDALADGRIDAAALFPPYSEEVLKQGSARPLFSSAEIPGEIFDILVIAPAALRDLGPALPRLLRAWQEAHTLRRRDPEQAIPLMARREGLNPRSFQQSEQGLRYFSLDRQRAMLAPGGLLARNLRAVQQVQAQLQLLPAGSPLPRVSQAPLLEALR
ncbi:MAG: ABC transporter substrate-binding protein [Synechococcaceae cyanobacterium]|nr:ABC transporter substrate-binding protein [Synechococcaceae cyanobacterium]